MMVTGPSDEDGPGRVGDGPVHHPRIVVDHPEVSYLVGQLAGDLLGVCMRHGDEHAQSLADRADGLTVDGHRRLPHPLHQSPHSRILPFRTHGRLVP